MKYSYNWLKELTDTTQTPEQVAEGLTMHAFEVEGLEQVGSTLDGVVVGEIRAIEKHPNADRLQVTKVTTDGKNELQIVCGAHNIAVGDRIPVATVGTKLPAGIEIKEAEIRGVKSFGMLCAQDELGLGDDHSGIIILDKKTPLGKPVAQILGGIDWALEIKVLPDRAHDAASHVGLAREIAAISGKVIDYDYDGLILPKKKTANLQVEIEKPEICRRYVAVALSNITVAPSPEWIQQKLVSCGLRPINNVVDATNLVMLELGQPLHAFDQDKIAKNGTVNIVVRNAKKGEKIQILDETVKELIPGDIVIANDQNALAIAGVMGGLESGVTQETKNIILESATFNPTAIRKTKNRLNLFTDAAMRFEKDLDPNLAEKAMVRLIEILEHIASAQLEGAVDVYPDKKKPWVIKLDLEYANKLLGEQVSAKTSKQILKSLGFSVSGVGTKVNVTVPTFRLDALTQEDLIEEIGRVYGYDKIASRPQTVSVAPPVIDEKRLFIRGLKRTLVGQGFSEVYNYSFYSLRDANLAQLGSLKHLELEAPMNPDQELIRVSLIPNMLKNVRENLKHTKDVAIFEIGRVFWPDEALLPEEKMMLAGAVAIDQKAKSGKDKRHETPFFAAKSYVDQLMTNLGITDHYYDMFEDVPLETPSSVWHTTRSAQIKIEGTQEVVGYIGEINPFILVNYDVHQRVAFFEFDVEKLRKVSTAEREYEAIRRYPTVMRDLSLVVKDAVLVDEILAAMQKSGGDAVIDVDLFDIFDFADGTTSYAFHVMLGSNERTLRSEEIDQIMDKIVADLEATLPIQHRK